MSAKSGRKRFWSWFWAAVAGIVSAAAFLAVAELVALLVARDGSPVLAVGSFVIDIVPQPFKEFAIATFGANDKLALLVGLALGVVVAAAVTGVLQYLRPPLGVVALVVAGALSVAAIVTRAGATPLASVPPIAGTAVGCVVLVLLVRRLRAWRDAVSTATRRDARRPTPSARASIGGRSSGSRRSPGHPPSSPASARAS